MVAKEELQGSADQVAIAVELVDERLIISDVFGTVQSFDDDPSSGDVTVQLGSFPAGTRVTSVELTVGGRPFNGRLANLQGAKVLASPVLYSAVGTVGSASASRAYIVDLGGVRSVLGLWTGATGQRITLVLPWMGMDFGPIPSFPAGAKAGSALPSGVSIVSLTGIETTKVLIQVTGSSLPTPDAFAQQCQIALATHPTNVRASLNGRLAFWTAPGPLSDPVEPAGLVQELNTVLASATETTAAELSLTADATGVFEVTFDPASGVESDRTASAEWGGGRSTEVALRALESVTLDVPFPTDDAGPWSVGEVDMEVTGAFPAWRAYPAQATAEPGPLGLRVDAGLTVARRFASSYDAQLHGVALAVQPGGTGAQVHVEVVAEKDGAPGSDPPLAAADVALGGSGGSDTGWAEVLFAKPVAVRADDAIWFVAKAKTGSIEWTGAPEAVDAGTRTMVAAEGGRWERHPPIGSSVPVAQIRILRAPLPNEHEPVLTLGWPDLEPVQGAEPGREPIAVELARPVGQALRAAVEDGSATLSIRLRASATGTLSIASADAVYQEASA